MPSFTGRYEYLAPGAGPLQAGPCEFSFDERAFTLVSSGAPIAGDLGDIDVFLPGEYELRLALSSGHALRLSHFAKAFQNLERELLEAYRQRLVQCLLVSDLDEVARFSGRVSLRSPQRTCEGPAEVRLYESNVAILPDTDVGFQWRLADIDRVDFDERDYAVTIRSGQDVLTIGRLAKRTRELADRLNDRVRALEERSARALGAVFPFLSPEEFRRVGGLLREGVSVPITALRGIHRLIEPTLLEKVVDGALRPYLQSLAGRTTADGWFVGFKIVRRTPEEAAATSESDEATDAVAGAADAVLSDATEAQGAEADEHVADAILEVGPDLDVLFWFFFPIAGHGQTAASRIAWEAVSSGGRATYVFDARGEAGVTLADSVAELNRGLVALNFRREPVYLPSERLAMDVRYRHYAIALRKVPVLTRVRDRFRGRAIHTTLRSWQTKVDALVG